MDPEVFWAPKLDFEVVRSWEDLENTSSDSDSDSDDERWLMAQEDMNKIVSCEECDSEEDLSDFKEQHEHDLDLEVPVQVEPEVKIAPTAPKEEERQLSENERKKKEPEEPDALLKDVAVSGMAESIQEKSREGKDGVEDGESKNVSLESKSAKKKKDKSPIEVQGRELEDLDALLKNFAVSGAAVSTQESHEAATRSAKLAAARKREEP